MIKFTLSPLIVCLFPIMAICQFGPQNVLNSVLESPYFVDVADLDNDNKNDILACSFIDYKIVWFKNESGEFSSEQVISLDAVRVRCVKAADLDGDGDLDIVAALDLDNQIVWFENDLSIYLYYSIFI